MLRQDQLDLTVQTLYEYRNCQQILDALASLAWQGEGQCPRDRLPTAPDLAVWLPDFDRWNEVLQRMQIITQTEDGRSGPWPEFDPLVGLHGDGADLAAIAYMSDHMDVPPPPRFFANRLVGWIEALHRAWAETYPRECKHPVAPIISQWQIHSPRTVERDQRPNGILPEIVSGVPRVLFRTNELDQAHSGGTLVDVSRHDEAHLPGLAPQPSAIIPTLPVVMYSKTRRKRYTGKVAPISLRLMHELTTAVPVSERRHDRRIHFASARELMNYAWNGKITHVAAQFQTLLDGLEEADSILLDAGPDIAWSPFRMVLWPKHPDAPISAIVTGVPGGTATGGGIFSRSLLRGFSDSYRLYRAYLGLVSLRNQHQTHKGKLQPTFVPEVRRERGKPSGTILDVHTGKPLIDMSGKHHRPVTSLWHPLAKDRGWTGQQVANPAVTMPWLTDRELVELFSDLDWDQASPGARRKQTWEAKQDIARLVDRGLLVSVREYPDAPTERGKGRYRLFLTEFEDSAERANLP